VLNTYKQHYATHIYICITTLEARVINNGVVAVMLLLLIIT